MTMCDLLPLLQQWSFGIICSFSKNEHSSLAALQDWNHKCQCKHVFMEGWQVRGTYFGDLMHYSSGPGWSSCDTAGLCHDHKSLCSSLANLPSESKAGLAVRLQDGSKPEAAFPGLPYSSPAVSWAHAGWVSPWWEQIQDAIKHHRNHSRGCWSGVRTAATRAKFTLVHTMLWCTSTATKINCVCFRVHFCVLASRQNHLVNFLSSCYFFM